MQFSNWTLEYYWLSGRLLETKADADLEVAFSITERMRARSLLDALNRSRLRPDPALPAVTTRRSLLTDIARLQRTLMDPTLPPEVRRSGLATLGDLESREREAERQIAVTLRANTARPSFATLDALQSALGKDEALLSFQVGIWETYEGDFGGGSWLLVLTAADGRLSHSRSRPFRSDRPSFHRTARTGWRRRQRRCCTFVQRRVRRCP